MANFQLQEEFIFNLTVCFWLKRLDSLDVTIFSYMSPTSEEELYVSTPFEIWLKGKQAPSLGLPFDTQWQHLCMKYFHATGNLKLLVGGETELTEWGFSYNQTFSGEGSLIIGQRQDSFAHVQPSGQGGHFMLSEFNIWNYIIYSKPDMRKMADCSLGVTREQGNVIMWSDVVFLDQEIPKVYEMQSMCITCAEPMTPFNGSVIGSPPYFDDATVTFVCDSGFSLVGVEEISCGDGEWSNIPPQCFVVCPDVEDPINGNSVGSAPYFNDETITFSCMDGLQLIGSVIITCHNGSWSDDSPQCGATCQQPASPVNGRVNGSPPYDDGVIVTYDCDSGFSLVGFQNSTCVNGSWTAKPPECLVVCPAIEVPDNVHSTGSAPYLDGHNVVFSCYGGLHLIGPKNITCHNGVWSENTPTCKGLCSAVEVPMNVSITGSAPYVDGEVVVFSCDDGLDLIGPMSVTCHNGSWTDGPPTCIEIPKLHLEVRCVSNCGPKVVLSASLSVYIRCLDCKGEESPSYRWTLSSSNGEIDDLPGKTETGVTGVGIKLAANTLPMSTDFVLTGKTETPDGTVGISGYQFITEYPPYGGNCSISPSEGIALETSFIVECAGWRISPICKSMTYEVWIRDNVTIPIGSYEIIHVGEDATTPALHLILGNPSNNYLIDVMVKICDDTGECTAQHYNIKVQVESPVNVVTVHENLESDDSTLKRILEEDPSQAVGFIFLVSNNVNQMTSDKIISEEGITKIAEIREILTEGLLEATSHDVDINGMGILQRAIATKSVSSYNHPRELSLTTQIKIADTLIKIASAFEEKQDEVTIETATSIVKELIQSADNIFSALDAAMKSEMISKETESGQEAKFVVWKTFIALNSTLSSALNTVLPGQSRITYQTDIIEVQLIKFETSIHAETQVVSKYGTLKVPESLLDIEDKLRPMSTKFVALARNPFVWSSESYFLESPIFYLEMLYESGQSVSAVQTTDPDSLLEVAIAKESPIDTTDSREPSKKSWANFHDFEIAGTQTYMLEVNVPADNSVMLISVATNETTAALLLYIHSDNYQFNTSLAWNESLNIDDGMRQVVIGPLGDAASYTLAMELGVVSQDMTANANHVFRGKVAVSLQVCRYYDLLRDKWASDGCKVSLSTMEDYIVCKCDML
ncbi:uncharacterized protein [Ptychodera flava]|uniref:uncharacterized protein n=1 Tax=Ptychodera flava TaxID=63121 RepID=UPI00396A3DD2